MERLLRTLVEPSAGAIVLALGIVTFYGIGVWFVDIPMQPETRSIMALLPWLSAAFIVIGSFFFRHQPEATLDHGRAHLAVYGLTLVFVAFCAITLASASSIPLIQALHGASPAEIAVAREDFLKARVGWQVILPYINGLLTASILPYCMSLALLHRYRFRYVIVAIFLMYSMIFVEKAFFLRIFLPLMAVVVVSRARFVKLTWLLAMGMTLLILNVVISGFTESTGTTVGQFLIFRAFSVPVTTVVDSLDYWWKTYNGNLFFGATNLLLSSAFGLPRVQFEREVFEYEWGASVTGTGSSNSAFFVEAYVNFGIPGVIVASLLLGMLISYIGRSQDLGLRCILPLVLYSVFVGGMLGLLFGNGLLVCLVLSAWLKRRLPSPETTAALAPPSPAANRGSS